MGAATPVVPLSLPRLTDVIVYRPMRTGDAVSRVYIRSLSQIPRFFVDASTFSSLPQNTTYRPLLSVTYAVDYWLGGGVTPRQFHLTQFVMLLCLSCVSEPA